MTACCAIRNWLALTARSIFWHFHWKVPWTLSYGKHQTLTTAWPPPWLAGRSVHAWRKQGWLKAS